MIFILTGAVGSGKTTFLRSLAEELGSAGVSMDGFLSLRVMEGKETAGYDLFDIQKRRSSPFLRRMGCGDGQKVGAFCLLPEGLAQAENIILRSRTSDLLVVDEIGQLELEGKGLWPALKEALFDEQRSALLVIRRNLVAEYGRIFDPIPVKIFEENERADLAKSIIRMNEISVKVKFFAYFREIFGLKERDLAFFQSVTLRQLLNSLCDTPARRAELFASDQLKPHLVVMINGASPPAATGLDSKIKDGDVVSIFPLMGGG